MKRAGTSLPVKFALAAIVSLGLSGLAQAKDLKPEEQAMVHMGMSMDDVTQAIGKPMRKQIYRRVGTTTWTYGTTDYFERRGDRIFEVDFGPDGKVKSTGARDLPEEDSRP